MVIECDIEKLYKEGLSPTSYCYLYSLFKKERFLFEEAIPISVINDLRQKGYLMYDPDNNPLVTQKFKDFIQEREDTKNVAKWIDEYNHLFPTGVHNGGRPIRSSRSNCIKKMNAFLNEHKKITKADILEATDIYLRKKQKENYAYTVSSDYFISKDGISLLLSIIEDSAAREAYRQNREAGGSAFHKQV